MRSARERLQDILEAIAHIERYARRGRQAFEDDELVQSWCVRHLQIIGEAARRVPPEVRSLAPEIAWSDVVGMRHILVHDYFAIDVDVVWDAIERDLPKLRDQIEQLLERLDSEP